MRSRRLISSIALATALLGACIGEGLEPPPRGDGAEATIPPDGEVVPITQPPETFAVQTELATLYAFARAGSDVDLDGDTVIVSTEAERAYVYTRVGGSWGPATVLTDAIGDADLGTAVAIEGDIAVLGAKGYDPSGLTNVGAVLVFERAGGVWGPATMIESPVQQSHYGFGRDVEIANGTIFVGAPNDGAAATKAGAVYRYQRDALGVWQPHGAPIRPATLSTDDQFGAHLAADGSRLAVGVPFDNTPVTDAGTVYVIDLDGTSFSAQRLEIATGQVNRNLGRSVAIAGDTLLAGAPSAGSNVAGAAFVWEYDGNDWIGSALPHPPASGAQFGTAVALAPPLALVSAQQETVTQPYDGVVHLFSNDGTGWQGRQALYGAYSPPVLHGVKFGASVALGPGTALVGWPNDTDPSGSHGSVWAFTAVGAPCGGPGGCPSGLCVDGYCCNAACEAPCERCDVPDHEGVCTLAPAHHDPSCGPYLCDGQAPACPTTCADDDQCDDDHQCRGDVCVPKAAVGTPCVEDEQCASGHCVDGRCCDGPCAAQCEACDAPGSEGTCVLITGTPRGDRPACPADRCDEGVEAVGSVCAGEATCAPPVETACAPYACGEAGCRTSCALPEHCLAGYVCDYERGLCLGDAPICEGDVLHHPDGSTTRCAPYRCTAAGACLASCTFSGDCAGGHICSSSGACVEAPNLVTDGGCAVAGGPSRRSPDGIWLLGLAGFGLFAHRRRRCARRRRVLPSGP